MLPPFCQCVTYQQQQNHFFITQILVLIQLEKGSNSSCCTVVLGSASTSRFCPMALWEESINPLNTVSLDSLTITSLLVYFLKCPSKQPNLYMLFPLHLSSLAHIVCYEARSGVYQRCQEWLVPLHEWWRTGIWSSEYSLVKRCNACEKSLLNFKKNNTLWQICSVFSRSTLLMNVCCWRN